METYSFLRELADSWALLGMFAFFMGILIWVLLPASRQRHDEAAMIPLRYEDKPAPDGATQGGADHG